MGVSAALKRLIRKFLKNEALSRGRYASLWRRLGRPTPEEWAEYLRRHGGFQRFGSNCHINPSVHLGDRHLISIGNNVWMTGGWMACHDGSAIMINQAEGTNFDAVAPIIIGDNVFIGYGSIILPGVTIGSNVVIGAGSVVSRDVPDRSIVAGAPARQIGTYDAYLDKLVARNEDLPWRHLIECRKGGYDPSLEPGLAKLRQAHFFG